MAVVQNILGPENILEITALAFIERKGLYRDGLFKCRGFAELNQTAQDVMDEGLCGCLDLDLTQVCIYLYF